MPRILSLLCLAAVGACASQTRLPEPVRAAVSARHTGRTVELRQSYYWGELYDENEKWLLSPYPYDETYHIVDTKGAPIHPHGQRGILPAGSAFVVQRVEFPDVAAMASRMLTTPRYNPWIYLVPADSNTAANRERKYFILLLPMDLDSEAGVEAEINKLLAPAGEVQKWLEARRPTVRVAIEHKEMMPEMTLEELVASMGEPRRWLNDTAAKGPARIAWYPSKEAWLIDGVVTEVKPARAMPDPSAPPATAAATSSPAPAPASAPAPAAPAPATGAPAAGATP